MLRYQAPLQRYVGCQVTVTVEAFDAVLIRLMQRGYPPEDAYTLLLHEGDWDAAWPGVGVVGGDAAVDAVERLLRQCLTPVSASLSEGEDVDQRP